MRPWMACCSSRWSWEGLRQPTRREEQPCGPIRCATLLTLDTATAAKVDQLSFERAKVVGNGTGQLQRLPYVNTQGGGGGRRPVWPRAFDGSPLLCCFGGGRGGGGLDVSVRACNRHSLAACSGCHEPPFFDASTACSGALWCHNTRVCMYIYVDLCI